MDSVKSTFLTIDAEIEKFNRAKKSYSQRENSAFKNVKFPYDLCYEYTEYHDLQHEVLHHLELLQYDEFKNVFQAFRQIHGTPLIPSNFDYDDLKKALLMVMYESNSFMTVYDIIKTSTLEKHFQKPKGFLSKPIENNECFRITIKIEWVEFIYGPIVENKTVPEAPTWSFPFVQLMKIVGKSKKWQHNLASHPFGNKNVAHDKKKPLEFLIFSNAYLKEVGLIE